jgi:hypothetical protein
MTSESEKVDVHALIAGLLHFLQDGLTASDVHAVCCSRLRKHVLAFLKDNHIPKTVINQSWDRLTSDQRDWLVTACREALKNEAPEVASYQMVGSSGPYSVLIRGVPGAYFIESIEDDELGPFETLEQAKDALEFNYWGAKPIGSIAQAPEVETLPEPAKQPPSKTKGARIVDLGWRNDTDPRYNRGWTFLSGKYLNPNLPSQSKPTEADDKKDRRSDGEER